jgi:hypothetical protein
MSYTKDSEILEPTIEELITNIKNFRSISEKRIMNTQDWGGDYRLKLKNISDKLYNIQIELNNL